jgi:hypothetical protein
MYCGKTKIPIGSKVTIVSNVHGTSFEDFIGEEGVATHPYFSGCRHIGWVGVSLNKETKYGNKFNFHQEEIAYETP